MGNGQWAIGSKHDVSYALPHLRIGINRSGCAAFIAHCPLPIVH
jgi:hypothetical protein